MISATVRALLVGALLALCLFSPIHAKAADAALDAMIAKHSAAHGVPEALVRRVIMIESRYNPRLVHAGNYGLMQIRFETARFLGYRGDAGGLLDPDTNLGLAVKYLAGALRAAGGNHAGAVRNYQRGYSLEPRRKALRAYATAGDRKS
jgi:soluble lytic murein transglycosylase-like protein